MLNPENIDVEEDRDFETDAVIVHARFRASLAIVISREELMANPQAATEASAKVIREMASNPDAYSVGRNARALRIRLKDLE